MQFEADCLSMEGGALMIGRDAKLKPKIFGIAS